MNITVNLHCLIRCKQSESKINYHNDIPASIRGHASILACTKGRQAGYFRGHPFIPIYKGKTKEFSVHKDWGISLETE